MIKKKSNIDIFRMFFKDSPKFVCEKDLKNMFFEVYLEINDVKILLNTFDDSRGLLNLDKIKDNFNKLIIHYEFKNQIINYEYIPILFRFEDIDEEFEKPVNIFVLSKFVNYLYYDYELAERVSADYDLLLFLQSLYVLGENLPWKGFSIALKNLPNFIRINLEGIIKKFNEKNGANVKIERKDDVYILINDSKEKGV